MPHSPLVVANYLIEKAAGLGFKIREDSLQIMLYYTYGFYSRTSDTPLFQEGVQVWVTGPNFATIYRHHHKTVRKVCNPIKLNQTYDLPKEITDILDYVFDLCRDHRSYVLKMVSCAPGTPWYTMKRKNNYLIIPYRMIKEHFESSHADEIKLKMLNKIMRNPDLDQFVKYYLCREVYMIRNYKLEELSSHNHNDRNEKT